LLSGSDDVEDDVYENYIAVRMKVSKLLADDKNKNLSLTSIAALLWKRKGTWIAQDPTFIIEIAVLLTLTGDASIPQMQTTLMNMLPQIGEEGDLGAVRTQIEALNSQPHIKFIHEDAKTILVNVRKIINQLCNDRYPDTLDSLDGIDFYQKYKERTAGFMSALHPNGQKLCGKDAVIALNEQLDIDLRTGSEEITLDDCTLSMVTRRYSQGLELRASNGNSFHIFIFYIDSHHDSEKGRFETSGLKMYGF